MYRLAQKLAVVKQHQNIITSNTISADKVYANSLCKGKI